MVDAHGGEELRQQSTAEKGMVSVEFALAIPALVMLLAAIVTLVSIALAQLSLSHAIGQAARQGARHLPTERITAIAHELAGPEVSVTVTHSPGKIRVHGQRTVSTAFFFWNVTIESSATAFAELFSTPTYPAAPPP